MTERNIAIRVPVLARVEGEGALHIDVRAGRIETLRLEIFEPPRLFEQFLVGRSFEDVPDMVARICGICPVAYQISAVNALEDAFGVEVDDWVRAMRRVLYCGEWIQSHCLHIHLLAAPDFFGFQSATEMAGEHPDEVRRGLLLQGLGNDLVCMLGGRSVHPVGVRVGGFHRAPDSGETKAMARRLRDALPMAAQLVRWAAGIAVPPDSQAFESVAMRHDSLYPLDAGVIVSDRGLHTTARDYEQHFAEHQESFSTALYSTHDGQPYLVGPLARLNLAREQLPEAVLEQLAATGIGWPSRNMFDSLAARAVEVYFAIHEAASLLESYRHPAAPAVPVKPRAGVGKGCSEAPRGLLWHRYETDEQGRIVTARIVPPTSQNQARMEQDLHASLLSYGLDHDDDHIRLHCEKVVRNYDPCISCATHFLRLDIERV